MKIADAVVKWEHENGQLRRGPEVCRLRPDYFLSQYWQDLPPLSLAAARFGENRLHVTRSSSEYISLPCKGWSLRGAFWLWWSSVACERVQYLRGRGGDLTPRSPSSTLIWGAMKTGTWPAADNTSNTSSSTKTHRQFVVVHYLICMCFALGTRMKAKRGCS